MKHALITGIYGQDGTYLAKFLLDKGYRVYGVTKHRTNNVNHVRLGINSHKMLNIIESDITDASSILNAVLISQPDEVYNLAAQSHVGYSFTNPQMTCAVNYNGYLNLLTAVKKIVPKARIYQAGTSEMFGYSAHQTKIQNEKTPFQPMSPYAISKVASHWAGINARIGADMFISNGILFNHESPLREIGFVTRKIVDGVVRIFNGENHIIKLGNIDSKRDWGHADDYVKAMWLMLQKDSPDDFVVSTGEVHSVRDFIVSAFDACDMKIEFVGEGTEEKGFVEGRLVLEIDSKFYRPNELSYLCGDSSKAKEKLGWTPSKGFDRLVDDMICAELEKK